MKPCPLLPAFVVSAVLFLAACAALPADGDAVECSRCRTMWVRLYAASPAPGFYRLDKRMDGHSGCARCEQFSVQFFESGTLRRHCADCGGMLTPRTVSVTR